MADTSRVIFGMLEYKFYLASLLFTQLFVLLFYFQSGFFVELVNEPITTIGTQVAGDSFSFHAGSLTSKLVGFRIVHRRQWPSYPPRDKTLSLFKSSKVSTIKILPFLSANNNRDVWWITKTKNRASSNSNKILILMPLRLYYLLEL